MTSFQVAVVHAKMDNVDEQERFEEAWEEWRQIVGAMPPEALVGQELISPLLRWLGYAATRTYSVEVCLKDIFVGSKRAKQKDVSTKPDYVLGPQDEWAEPGHPWAVIEAKKPGVDQGTARRQAQFYADHLKVPFYLVIDGKSLGLYCRQLLTQEQVMVEVNLTADDEQARAGLNQVYKLLRAPNLQQTVTKSREDNSSNTLLLAKRLLAWQEGVMGFKVEGAKLVATRNLEYISSATTWWGEPESRNPAPRGHIVVIAGETNSHKDFERAIVRLAIHGGIGRLEVDKEHVESWDRAIRVAAGKVNHSSIVVETRQPGFLRYDSTFDFDDLLHKLHSNLDEWTVIHVRAIVGSVLKDQSDEMLDEDHRTVWIADDTSRELQQAHAQEEQHLTASLLRNMVRQGRDSTNRPARRNGQVLLGLESAKYLADGWLAILAVCRAFDSLGPCAPHDKTMLNIGDGNDRNPSGLLVALPIPLRDSLAECFGDALLLALTREGQLPSTRIGRQFGQPWERDTKLGDPLLRPGVVLTLPRELRRTVARNGWAALVEGLKGQAKKQLDHGTGAQS